MDQDTGLAKLRATFGSPWEFERLGNGRIKAVHGRYTATGDNAGAVSRTIMDWMSHTGLTGDGGMTVAELGAKLAEPGF